MPPASHVGPSDCAAVCCHAMPPVVASNACRLGSWINVSCGFEGSQTGFGGLKSPMAVAPYTRTPSYAVLPRKPPEAPPKTTRVDQRGDRAGSAGFSE